MKTKKQKLKEKCVKLVTKIKLKKYPYCVFCHKKADTCHHFIHQSRSNLLRTDEDNLIPICNSCHYRLHSGYEQVMTGKLIKKYGQKWFDELEKKSRVRIKDNISYWQAEKERLEQEAEDGL